MNPDFKTPLAMVTMSLAAVLGGTAFDGCFSVGDTMVGAAMFMVLAAQWRGFPKNFLLEAAYCMAIALTLILMLGVISDMNHYRAMSPSCDLRTRELTFLILWIDLTGVVALFRWLTHKVRKD